LVVAVEADQLMEVVEQVVVLEGMYIQRLYSCQQELTT
jgi:hypothetical protein